MFFPAAWKLDHHRLFEHVRRLLDLMALGGKRHQAFFVAALCQPLVKQAAKLTFQFTRVPILADRFDLVESTRFGFADAQQRAVVGPGKPGVKPARLP